MLTQDFAKAMKRLFPDGLPAHALVAVSGGLDSMVLLDLFTGYLKPHPKAKPKPENTQLTACYVDHGQRSDTAEDKKVIGDYCKQHGIPFVAKSIAGLGAGASESALRGARYAALTEAAHDIRNATGATSNLPVIVTAHHAQDDLETYLFRFLRGAHPETIKGIPAKARRGHLTLARPLLIARATKEQLHAYAVARGLKWHEDSTNAGSRYARNRIRQELLPLLEELRPGAKKRMLTFFRDLTRNQARKKAIEPSAQAIRDTQAKLRSPDGIDIRSVRFHLLKATIDELLAEHSSRTTQAHWLSLKAQLKKRQATRSGGGPRRVVQFPGGHCLCFDGSRLYWDSCLGSVKP